MDYFFVARGGGGRERGEGSEDGGEESSEGEQREKEEEDFWCDTSFRHHGWEFGVGADQRWAFSAAVTTGTGSGGALLSGSHVNRVV